MEVISGTVSHGKWWNIGVIDYYRGPSTRALSFILSSLEMFPCHYYSTDKESCWLIDVARI